MKNPTKFHVTTLGKKDFAFEDRAKEDKILTHKNALKQVRHDYKSLLPAAPSMNNESPMKKSTGGQSISPLKYQYSRNDSFVTLGDAANSKAVFGRNTS